ncbi:MAG: polysaccharide biosynthesis C-terminal domain-containing protein, partial [Candidatus Omnitrophica bacterium]|nr:polysaccharide biosynthesis C-terminal domain-containing protein [Candidatus Omnitrophota bacterium]
VVRAFLPKCAGGIDAMRVLLIGYYFMAVTELSSSILFTMNEQKKLIPVYVVVLLWAALLDFAAIRMGYGIVGVAVATAVAYFTFFLSVFTMGFSKILERAERLRMVGAVILMFVFMVALDGVAGHLGPWGRAGWGALVRLGVFGAGFLPVCIYFAAKERLWDVIRGVIQKSPEVPSNG